MRSSRRFAANAKAFERAIDFAQARASAFAGKAAEAAKIRNWSMLSERILRWALVTIAVAGLSAGIIAYAADRPDLANLCWTLATAPVVAGLAVSIARDLLAGRFGVDAIALVS